MPIGSAGPARCSRRRSGSARGRSGWSRRARPRGGRGATTRGGGGTAGRTRARVRGGGRPARTRGGSGRARAARGGGGSPRRSRAGGRGILPDERRWNGRVVGVDQFPGLPLLVIDRRRLAAVFQRIGAEATGHRPVIRRVSERPLRLR